MADFVANSTKRLRVRYRANGRNHSMTFRWQVSNIEGDVTDMVDKVSAFVDALSPMLTNDWKYNSMEWAAAGSDVFLPVALPAQPTGAQPSLAGTADAILSLGFVGRGALGGKARLFIYGYGLFVEGGGSVLRDFRIQPGERAEVTSAIAILNDLAPEQVATDGSVVQWYPYANVKFNDYWMARVRQGS